MRKLLLFISLFFCFQVHAQPRTVTGRVTSEADPEGLPGVNVVVKGTNDGTITDINGNYSLSVPEGAILVYSFVGYQTQEVLYNGQEKLDVILQEEARELSEVVVVGYSSVERRDITGSITSVKSTDFQDISLSGIDQALQGQAPGVQVTQSSGTPGGGIQVRIRGVTSIGAGNSPLWIIDGVQVETGTLSLRSFGGQNDNALSLINPGDIESYEVLKDAQAKALYGSRASNGVIVVTTKRGRKGQTRINFDVQRGIVDPVNKLDLLDATQLLELQREAVENAGQNPDGFGLIPGVTDAVNTDWQDEVLRRGIMQQYQLSATGGDDLTSYYLSMNYRNEEGVQLNNLFERLGTMINIDRKFNSKLTVSSNVNLTRTMNKRVKGDNFLDGVYSGAVKSLPYYTPYDENGFLIGPNSPQYAGFPNFNPVAQAVLPRFNAVTAKMISALKAQYQINRNFTLRGHVSVDYNDVTEDQYESSQTAIGGFLPSVGGQGYGVFIASTSTNVNYYMTLGYNRTIGDAHSFTGLAGYEVVRGYGISGNVQGRIFPSDDFTYIGSAAIVDNGSSGRSSPTGLQSFFAEGKYDYKDRILASLSFRADGSSRFGPNRRFGYFPAASVAWRISSEDFFHSRLINDLKVRTSFGFTGNERIGNFQFLGLWSSATYNGNSGVGPVNVANPSLKWETTREANFGVDVMLLEGRVQAILDLYYNKTFDLLLPRPLASTTGFGSITDNIGEMENKGIELGITTVNMDRQVKWSTDINLSKNMNKVLFLSDTLPLYRGYSAEGVNATNIIQVGHPLGTFIGLKFLGVDPATGDAIYQDTNNDGLISNDDAIVIGNAQPDFYGGVTNRVSYKRFEASIFFQFSVGNKILNFGKTTFVNTGADIVNNQSVEALRRWRQPGDITDVPRYEFENTFNNYHSSRFLEDGSYLRLKNLSIGYRLPTKYADRLLMQNVRIYCSGTNLWTF
ncbi:MAG TPA: TonB-dependent receptor, partial [Chryseosolibacter sp.]|nr:TonB-dependent receptor [Chryseosolibacter sp.]